jgi:2-amino-4-hydroxy-6-hydroxymethyldihydropteridine diphosphokinase
MKTWRAFIGLGSNIGNRAQYLNKAAAAMGGLPSTRTVWFSPVFESDPYGKTDQSKFLNAVGEIETGLAPPALLEELKKIEQALGRSKSEHWGPREIDLDILVYDGLVLNDDAVTVPHPDLEHRRFVLVPLREIAPDLVHPVNGMTVEEMAAACRDAGRVVRTADHIRL